MAEPKKETTRIALPPRPEQAGTAPNVPKTETTRIVLPSRTPVTPIRRPPKITPSSASPLLQPLPKPVPTPVPAINMTKTQPLPVHPPASGIQPAPVIITSKPLAPLDTIPRPLCWAVLGISALIFLIQIWNYVVS